MSDVSRTKAGAKIQTVVPSSAADAAGIKAGEHVQSINGLPASDYIDWLWESDGSEIELEIVGIDGKSRIVNLQREVVESAGDESSRGGWGIEFPDIIWDGIHNCANDCVFCFMQQLPDTARGSLRMRDDDYRLSFLQGNFITLTNLSDADKQRIVDQNVSPLRVSFHAANEEVREKLIGKNQAAGLKNLDDLIAAGINFHIQIVLLPGINDGTVLEETLQYLQDPKRLSHVLSVGIVPVAFTDYAPVRLKDMLNSASLPDEDREEWSKSVIEQVQRHQFEQYEQRDLTWVYLADEFYIHAHAPFPLPEFYDGFPQLENGIGMVLNFIADVREHFEDLASTIAALPNNESITIVCGELLAQTWLGVLSAVHAGGKLRLLPVRNRYFGGNVSVTGLLTADDILRAVQFDSEHLQAENQDAATSHCYLVPDCIFNDNGRTLDDCNVQQLKDAASVQLDIYRIGIAGLIESIKEHTSHA